MSDLISSKSRFYCLDENVRDIQNYGADFGIIAYNYCCNSVSFKREGYYSRWVDSVMEKFQSLFGERWAISVDFLWEFLYHEPKEGNPLKHKIPAEKFVIPSYWISTYEERP